MTLRVLVIDHTAKASGGELALLRVVERISSGDATIRVLVFEDGPLVERLRAAGIETAVLPLDPATNDRSRDRLLAPAALARSVGAALSHLPRLVRVIRRSGAELIVANTLKSAVFVALAAPLAGRPWVWHLHDRLAPDYLPSPLVAALRCVAVLGPRAVVVNSEATLETLPGRARRKAFVAYPGLTPRAFEPAMSEASDAHPVVGIIGRVSPTKGQSEFLSAAALVASAHPDVGFRVVGAALFGETDYESGLIGQAERLGISDSVEFTGWVEDPAEELVRLTVLVHASPVPEPFGQVVAEAMAAGVPVVATDAGGIRDQLAPGRMDAGDDRTVRVTEFGVLVAPGDITALAEAVDLVLADPESAAARANAARRTASARFRIEQTVDVVLRAWRSAAARR